MKLVILGFILLILIINLYMFLPRKEGYRNYKNPADANDDNLQGSDTQKTAIELCNNLEECVGIFKKKASEMYNLLYNAGKTYGIGQPDEDIEKVWVIDDQNEKMQKIYDFAGQQEGERIDTLKTSQQEIDNLLENYHEDKEKTMYETELIPGAKIDPGDDTAFLNSLKECNTNITGVGGIPEGVNCTGFFKEYGKFNFYFLQKGNQNINVGDLLDGKRVGKIYRHKTKYEEPDIDTDDGTGGSTGGGTGVGTGVGTGGGTTNPNLKSFYCAHRPPANRGDVAPDTSTNLKIYQAVDSSSAIGMASNEYKEIPSEEIECGENPFTPCESGDGRRDDDGNLACKEPISVENYEFIQKNKVNWMDYGNTNKKGQSYCRNDMNFYDIETVEDCLAAGRVFKEQGENLNIDHPVPKFRSPNMSSGCIVEKKDGNSVRFNDQAKSLTTVRDDDKLYAYICRKGEPESKRNLPKIDSVTLGTNNRYLNVKFSNNIYSNQQGNDSATSSDDVVNKSDFRVSLEADKSNYFANKLGNTEEEILAARKIRPPKQVTSEGFKNFKVDLHLIKNARSGQKIKLIPQDTLFNSSGHVINKKEFEIDLGNQPSLVCDAYEVEGDDYSVNKSYAPQAVNCVGSFGECGSNCKKVYNISTPATYGGTECPHPDGYEEACIGDNCPPINCSGTYDLTQCDASCKTTFQITTPASQGGTCSQEGSKQDCDPYGGHGDCPLRVDCVGSFGPCNSDCKMTYNHDVPAQNGGNACPYPQGHQEDCNAGVGECPQPIDCVGSWGQCNAGCRKRYTITQNAVPSPDLTAPQPEECKDNEGNILTNDSEMWCNAGEDECPQPIDCVGSWGDCGTNCKKVYNISTPAVPSPSPSASPPQDCKDNRGNILTNGQEQDCTLGEGSCAAINCEGEWDLNNCDNKCFAPWKITQEKNRFGEDCKDNEGNILTNDTKKLSVTCKGKGSCPSKFDRYCVQANDDGTFPSQSIISRSKWTNDPGGWGLIGKTSGDWMNSAKKTAARIQRLTKKVHYCKEHFPPETLDSWCFAGNPSSTAANRANCVRDGITSPFKPGLDGWYKSNGDGVNYTWPS